MKANRARNEHLGYIDCIAIFTVLDGGLRGKPWSVQVTFEEFEATDVREVTKLASRARTSPSKRRWRPGAR